MKMQRLDLKLKKESLFFNEEISSPVYPFRLAVTHRYRFWPSVFHHP